MIRSERFKKISPTLGFDMKEVADLAEKKVIQPLKKQIFQDLRYKKHQIHLLRSQQEFVQKLKVEREKKKEK